MKDHLVKAVADGVRVYAAVTTDLVNEAIRRHGCHPVAAAALGRTMTGALLLAANLKNREALTVTFDGHGPLGKVTADATPEGFVRGYVTNPYVDLPQNAKGKIDVGGGVGTDGTVTVTRFTGLRNPVTGSAPLTDGEIADDLTKYLYVSEQTPSSVGLGVLIGHAGEKMACIGAGGFIIQPMPDATDETIDKLEANLKKVNSVSHMVEHGLDGGRGASVHGARLRRRARPAPGSPRSRSGRSGSGRAGARGSRPGRPGRPRSTRPGPPARRRRRRG